MTIRSIVVIAALVLGGALPGLADDRLVGTWDGTIAVDPGKVEVDFQISVTPEMRGEIWFPTQGPARHELVTLDLEGDALAFSTIDPQGIVSKFEGTLDGDRIEGELSEQGAVVPFTLRRVASTPEMPTPENPELTVLGADGQALRDAFDSDRDRVRILAILSPTCGVCRMGASMIERYLFERFEDPRLVVYVVWEPQLADDDEEAARDATFFLASERAAHFWSEERFAGHAYRDVLDLEEPAWDVFLVFQPGTVWGGTPEPAWYMHNLPQSSLPKDHLFDASILAERIDALLAEHGAAPRSGARDSTKGGETDD